MLYEFSDFGDYSGLRLNLRKTKLLIQGMGPWPSQVAGVRVASSIKYLGALFGDVTP